MFGLWIMLWSFGGDPTGGGGGGGTGSPKNLPLLYCC